MKKPLIFFGNIETFNCVILTGKVVEFEGRIYEFDIEFFVKSTEFHEILYWITAYVYVQSTCQHCQLSCEKHKHI